MNEKNLVQKHSHTTQYTDIVIFMLGYFNLNHSVLEHSVTQTLT